MNDDDGLTVLALNAGSSSLKFGLYHVAADRCELLVSGVAETSHGHKKASRAQDGAGETLAWEPGPLATPEIAVARIGDLLVNQGLPAPRAVGHRIVHGGPSCRQHTLIDATVLQHLHAATPFAPLHLPTALALVAAAQDRFPGIAQSACLDTAFHSDLPEVARTLAIPRDLRERGIERYGFHGLSCESIVRQLGGELPPRLVVAHLGHGASVTAIASGRSIDTSMGFTPAGGVIMSTRCGDLDPGVLSYVVRELDYDAARLGTLVHQQSGLLGISGISGDLRELHAAAGSNPDARLAVAMFGYSVRKQIAGMAVVLGGVDLLVFTGGIGENDPSMRELICQGLGALGIPEIPGQAGRHEPSWQPPTKGGGDRPESHGGVRVMPSKEDEQIARHTWRLASGWRAPTRS